MTATCWSHMEVGPHRGTRGGKGPRARLHNTLQQIVVDEYKRQNRRFRWIRFADASKQQVEALFSWRESLDSWHLWNFDQEAFDVIQAADNAYQQRLALPSSSDASISFLLVARFAHSFASHSAICRGKTSRKVNSSRGIR